MLCNTSLLRLYSQVRTGKVNLLSIRWWPEVVFRKFRKILCLAVQAKQWGPHNVLHNGFLESVNGTSHLIDESSRYGIYGLRIWVWLPLRDLFVNNCTLFNWLLSSIKILVQQIFNCIKVDQEMDPEKLQGPNKLF